MKTIYGLLNSSKKWGGKNQLLLSYLRSIVLKHVKYTALYYKAFCMTLLIGVCFLQPNIMVFKDLPKSFLKCKSKEFHVNTNLRFYALCSLQFHAALCNIVHGWRLWALQRKLWILLPKNLENNRRRKSTYHYNFLL